jgi:hypothetical protein
VTASPAKPTRRIPADRRRSEITLVRLTPGERAHVEMSAAAHGVTLSELIRRAVLPAGAPGS